MTTGEFLGRSIQTLADAESAVEELSSFTNGNVIITLDRDGAIAKMRGEKLIHSPTTPIDTGDSTGAGDIFRGIFISEFANSNNTTKSLKKAVEMGTRSVSIKGVDDSVKDIIEHM
ncbi:MAG: PfkB family carbohydrate kinase [Candidatus Dojkabacteria bacterium]